MGFSKIASQALKCQKKTVLASIMIARLSKEVVLITVFLEQATPFSYQRSHGVMSIGLACGASSLRFDS